MSLISISQNITSVKLFKIPRNIRCYLLANRGGQVWSAKGQRRVLSRILFNLHNQHVPSPTLCSYYGDIHKAIIIAIQRALIFCPVFIIFISSLVASITPHRISCLISSSESPSCYWKVSTRYTSHFLISAHLTYLDTIDLYQR